MKPADVLNQLSVCFSVDGESMSVDAFAPASYPDGSGSYMRKMLSTVGRAPETEEQLLALMQVIGREIWHHYLRQNQRN